MKKIFFFLSLCFAFHVYSQQTTLEKIFTDDLMSNEEVAPDDYGGVFNKNYTVNAVNAMIGSFGDAEMVIMKTDTGGNLMEHLVIGKPMYHDICTEAAFKNDKFYFAGYTRGIDTSASPLFTSFIVKTNEQLNLLQHTNYILPGADLFIETFTSGNGNYILSSGKYFDFNTSDWYQFIMKTDTTGNILWTSDPFQTPFLGTDIKKIIELPGGDIMLMGSITIGFEQSLSTLILFNNTGIFKWGRVYNYDLIPTQNSTLLFGKLMPNGNFIACGRTDYPGLGSFGQMDYQMIKIDTADGDLIWSKTFGGNQIDWLYGASYDQSTGKFILSGNSGSYFNPSFSAYYGACVQVDTAGMLVQSFIQGDTSDQFYNLFFANYTRLNGGKIMLGGSRNMGNSKFSLTRHSSSISSAGGCNYYPVTFGQMFYPYPTYSYSINSFSPVSMVTNQLLLDINSGISDSMLCSSAEPPSGIDEFEENGIEIYPNPSSDHFSILNKNNLELKEIIIYSANGEVAKKIVPNAPFKGIYHELPAGIYFIKISTSQKTIVKKLMVG